VGMDTQGVVWAAAITRAVVATGVRIEPSGEMRSCSTVPLLTRIIACQLNSHGLSPRPDISSSFPLQENAGLPGHA
jgi:hypothetical protein